MSVTDGQPGSATVFNNAFASKQDENTLTGKQNLANVAAASGSTVTNAQREINSLNSFSGRSSGSAYDAKPTWTDNSVGVSTDTLKDRAEALTTYAKALSDGKISGPGSSTDNAVVRFDGTGGKTAQNSSVLISDTNNVTGIVDLTMTGNLSSTGTTQGLGTSNSNTTVNIGTGSGTNTINLGGANTTTNFNGTVINNTVTNMNVTDKLITLNDGGAAASGSGVGFEVEENSVATGYVKTSSNRNSIDIKAPNTSGVWSVTPGSTTDTIVGAAAAQELTNKKFNGGTATAGNALRLIAPKATTAVLNTIVGTEGHIFYSTDEAKYYGDNGSALVDLGGSGSGVGGINYITNVNAEGGVTGWATYNDQQTMTVTIASPAVFTVADTALFYVGMPISFTTTGALPTGLTASTIYYISAIPSGTTYKVSATLGGSDVNTSGTQSGVHTDHPGVPLNGIGGTPDVTWTQGSSSVLRGSKDFRFAKGAAANYMGQGVYADMAVGIADAGAVLNVMMSYAIASGTYTDGDLEVWIVDTTNGTRIQLAPYKILNHTLNGDWFKGEFQTASSSVAYRLCIHVAKPSTSAYTLKFDQITSGPQASGKVYGSPVTDWISFTPTGSWISNTTYTGYWRRVGDSLQWRVRLALSGAPTSAGLTINYLPSGLSVDTTKFLGTSVPKPQAYGLTRSAGSDYEVLGSYSSATVVTVLIPNAASTSLIASSAVTQALPATYANGDSVELFGEVPILGWGSSQVASSESADSRLVAARAYAQNKVTTSGNPIDFAGVDFDTHNAITTGTWKYTIPVPGYYRVSASIYSATATFAVSVYKNGSIEKQLGGVSATTGVPVASGSVIVKCIAGDYLDIRPGTNITTINDTTGSWVSIEKIQSPAQVMASELIEAHYNTNAGQSIANNTVTIINFGTSLTDSHGSVTTGASWKFTAQRAGTFSVKARAGLASGGGWAVGEYAELILYKNNARVEALATEIQKAAHGQQVDLPASSTDIKLIAGDYIDIRIIQNSGGAISLAADGSYNFVSILSK